MGYSLDPISDNCYPGTAVLINKFDIHDEAKLNEVETVLVSARSAEWMEHPKADSFDFTHYKAVHHFLFSDLYDWAGQIRTVDISKKGTRFCSAENIERQAELIFHRLKERNYFKYLPHGRDCRPLLCNQRPAPLSGGQWTYPEGFPYATHPQRRIRHQLG